MAGIGYLSRLIGCLAPALIPPIHIFVLYIFWNEYAFLVDVPKCKNNCWDTVFKGPYENGVASYKHFYFNATSNTLKIWIVTVICVIVLYECVRYLTALILRRNLRFSFFVLFTWSIFSNYYSWWIYVNYWNDEFYSQWTHQLFFTITEVVSSVLMIKLADRTESVTIRSALGISSIAMLHILAGSYDQFIVNVVYGTGAKNMVIRDVYLMSADVINFVLPLYEFWKGSERRITLKDPKLRNELIAWGTFVLIGFIINSYI